ncbi:MAG TPA: L,D-transpeptidase family protein [Allosphingosinicella sp.]|jgi:murein L,D-transpeptidase YcbB/YkuD
MARQPIKRRWIAALLPLLAVAAAPAPAQVAPPVIEAALQSSADHALARFYAGRDHRTIWIKGNALTPDAARLVDAVRDAELDGMTAGAAVAASLEQAMVRARSGDPAELARAELMLSRALVDYVQALRRPADIGMNYGDAAVIASPPSLPEILDAAAKAPSLARHVETVSEVNPVYTELRKAFAAWRGRSNAPVVMAARVSGFGDSRPDLERLFRLNLDRARALPMNRSGRYILVDAAAQRLWMYEDGVPRDSMKVIVGKPGHPTPMIASMIHSAVLNPYWNVPPDLVRDRVAPKVIDQGIGYLKTANYEVLSDWSDQARAVDPAGINWRAVAAGQIEMRVRQRPGAGNSMGVVKFPFENRFGVYLHDTPEKELFAKRERNLSSGCVRLEDAPRLARWLLGSEPRSHSAAPEQVVALAKPVPVYITYLTLGVDGDRLAFRNDPYQRDAEPLRQFASNRLAARD